MAAFRSRTLALVLLTSAALLAFGANSILCRAALASGSIDPLAFALLRAVAGAVTLVALLHVVPAGHDHDRPHLLPRLRRSDWVGGLVLATYLVPFSWAYGRVRAGTGALVLFGAVQSTILIGGFLRGERPRGRQWIGLALAFAGLVVLVGPGLEAPPASGAAAMLVAGTAWGLYTLRARGTADPLIETASSFVTAIPVVTIVTVLARTDLHATRTGALLAIASGAIASGLGYVAWYSVVPALGTTRAAVLQLAVPLLAAAGAVAILGERFGPRLIAAALVLLTGAALAMPGPRRERARRDIARRAEAIASPQVSPGGDPVSRSRASWASQMPRTRSKVSASAAVLSGR